MSGTKVTVDLGEGTIVRLQARGHTWNADEPVEARGTDQGPNPYELLLGSLGSCTVLTLRFYAHHKKWPLQSVHVEYEFAREYARDCRECEEDDAARLDVIRARVTMKGDLDEAQRARLTEVVQRCPVHRTLAGGPKLFETVEFVPA
ncbi:OsmC family protein [bacterium]|nr:OsmC family protein [bacterium]